MLEKNTTASSPKLLDQVRHRLRPKHYSIRTKQAYVDWIRRFIRFHGRRHPRDMAAAEVEAFLTHLAVEGRVSASTQNQAKSALLFLYRDVQNLLATGADRAYLDRWAERLGIAPALKELLHD